MKYHTPSSIDAKYPPSDPCSCNVCRAFCVRPGWWTVEEAAKAFHAGLGSRMMLELSPDLSFGVLSPAFRGCEGYLAMREMSASGCNFLSDGLCELHNTAFQPLECRFCHHERMGLGEKCHTDLEKEWNTPRGQYLVNRWLQTTLKTLKPDKN